MSRVFLFVARYLKWYIMVYRAYQSASAEVVEKGRRHILGASDLDMQLYRVYHLQTARGVGSLSNFSGTCPQSSWNWLFWPSPICHISEVCHDSLYV